MTNAHQNLLLLAWLIASGGVLLGQFLPPVSPLFSVVTSTICLASAAILGVHLWVILQ